jgi:hypothetical protein
MKIFISCVVLFTSHIVFSQFGPSLGFNRLKGFGADGAHYGFHLGIEVPRDDETSIYFRGSFNNKRRDLPEYAVYQNAEAIDASTSPQVVSVSSISAMNYTTFEGGIRYYLFNGYDNSFSLYGGSTLMGLYNKVSTVYGEYDDTKYRLPAGNDASGAVINFALGFNGGVKYSIPSLGTFYFDSNLNYILLALPSNQMAATVVQNMGAQLLFSINIGFRKDLY